MQSLRKTVPEFFTEEHSANLPNENHFNSSLINKNWGTVKECSKFFGIPESTLKSRCIGNSKIKYLTRKSTGIGGTKYEININSIIENLKPKEKEIWLRKIEKEAISKVKTDSEIENDFIHECYAVAHNCNKIKFDKNNFIYTFFEGMRDKDVRKKITAFNLQFPEYKTAIQTVREIRKIVKESGKIGLIGKYGKNAGKTTVKDEWFEIYKELRLTQGQKSAKSCWIKVIGKIKELNSQIDISEIPSVDAFERRLKNEIPESARHLATKGFKSYNKKFNNYLNRTYDNLISGQVWVSDHRQLDFGVIDSLPYRVKEELNEWFEENPNAFLENGKNSKVQFPWITVWIDFKSGKWLGWFLHVEDPNTDHILYSFVLAAQKHGIPEEIYIDNGKDYRALDFAGGKTNKRKTIDTFKVTSLCATLRIKVNFSLPYNAQAKTIERNFKTFKEHLDKIYPTYRGGNIVERPERLNTEIKKGNIPFLSEVSKQLDFFIENIMNTQIGYGKVLKGRSRNQVWNEDMKFIEENGLKSPLRKVADDDLKMFMMRTARPQKIGRNGVCLSQKHDLYYWNDAMHGMKGTLVYLRRNNKTYQKAYVFLAKNDSFICEAQLNVWDVPAIAKTDLDKKQLTELLRKKNEEVKIDKRLGETTSSISVNEELRLHALGIKDLENSTEEIEDIPSPRNSQIIIKSKLSEANRKIKALKTGTDDFEFTEIEIEEKQNWVDFFDE
ncbi:MAG: DDE-type integrase/transposase/recombinase [Ignavibacteriae bacterium]|nr:DDE-type integrase/transposase/recombinase [Ignavibacteriota bacterium]